MACGPRHARATPKPEMAYNPHHPKAKNPFGGNGQMQGGYTRRSWDPPKLAYNHNTMISCCWGWGCAFGANRVLRARLVACRGCGWQDTVGWLFQRTISIARDVPAARLVGACGGYKSPAQFPRRSRPGKLQHKMMSGVEWAPHRQHMVSSGRGVRRRRRRQRRKDGGGGKEKTRRRRRRQSENEGIAAPQALPGARTCTPPHSVLFCSAMLCPVLSCDGLMCNGQRPNSNGKLYRGNGSFGANGLICGSVTCTGLTALFSRWHHTFTAAPGGLACGAVPRCACAAPARFEK
eukprot:gene11561-biopygen10918